MSIGQATLFTIESGEHNSSPANIKIFVGTNMNFSFVFDDSARYVFSGADTIDQIDVNKLYGFSDCKTSHMQNSARLGWRWNNNGIEILAFTHKNGQFSSQYITTVFANHSYNASIEISSDKKKYIYRVEGNTVEMDRGCEDKKAWGYHLKPYFGGNQAAPHEVTISVILNDVLGPAFVGLPYPNPVDQGRFKLNVEAYDNIDFYFRMYDVLGRLVYTSEHKKLKPDEDGPVEFDISKRFASALYFIVPITVDNEGLELRAGITNEGSQKSLKLMILNR